MTTRGFLPVRPFAVLLAATLCSQALLAQAPAQAAPKIAVVNIQKIFDNLEARASMEQELKVEIEKINLEMARLKVQLNDLIKQAGLPNPESEKRQQLEQQIYETKANMELYAKLSSIEFEERTSEMIKNLYEQIKRAIAAYSAQNNLTLVLKYDDTEVNSETGRDGLKLEINSRQVLYFKSSLDVTQQILQILNKGS